MEEPTPQFQKCFNSGYLLAKHEPELYQKLEQSLKGNSEYITGLQAGKKQHDREVLLAMAKQAQQNKSKGRGLDM